MNAIAITAGTLFTPAARIDDPLLLLEDSRIVEVTSRRDREIPSGFRQVDFGAGTLVPGYIDIHIHGGAGHDVMQPDSDALPAIQSILARHGVTGYLPTTITAPVDETLFALERLANTIDKCVHADGHPRSSDTPSLQAQPLGIHIEGPFLSHKRRGVHPPEFLQKPTVQLLDRMREAARGHIKLMTIAPEIEGALEVITQAVRLGICISLGHSDAQMDVARCALAAGARHATHTFNAMRPLNHRDPGILGFVLSESQLS